MLIAVATYTISMGSLANWFKNNYENMAIIEKKSIMDKFCEVANVNKNLKRQIHF